MHQASIVTPLGPVTLVEQDGALLRLDWGGGHADVTSLLTEAMAQMAAYFAGSLRRFDLPLVPAKGALDERMRQALCAIPFGETRRYGEIAADLALPAQAVGQLCGRNALPIVVPCHRVLARTGLGGFTAPGGIEAKVALLKREGAASLLI